MIEFLDITPENVHLYCSFNKIFDEDLKNFQKRIYPYNSDFFVVMIKENLLRWSYIVYEKEIIGAIWLEKDHPSLPVATLGVFISDKTMRSQGLGTKAIQEYIQLHKQTLRLSQVVLHVRKENIRAITCYKKCGFSEEKYFENAKGIKALEMIKYI